MGVFFFVCVGFLGGWFLFCFWFVCLFVCLFFGAIGCVF